MSQTKELNLDNYEMIAKEIVIEYKNNNDNITNYSEIIRLLKDSDPFNIFKGLVNLRKLCLIEKESEKEDTIIKRNDVNILFNILEKYPVEYKYECLECLTYIEYINVKLFGIVKYEPTEKVIKIIHYILDNPKEFNITLLETTFEYIYILTMNKNIIKIFNTNENILFKLKLLIEKEFNDDEHIIKSSLVLLIELIKEENQSMELANFNLELIPLLNNIISKYESNKYLLLVALNLLFIILYKYDDINGSPLTKLLDTIIEMNMLPKLMHYLDISDIINNRENILLSLRIIGNFAMVEDGYYTDKLLELNFLDKLKKLITVIYPFDIRKEAFLIISNISAGTSDQLIKLYENHFQDILFNIIFNEKEEKIKIKSLWALYNFATIKNIDYFKDIIEKGLLNIIVERFKIDDGSTLCQSLEALEKIISVGIDDNQEVYFLIKNKLVELNIVEELKDLLKRNIEERCKTKIKYILNNHLGFDNYDLIDTDDDENVTNSID